VGQILALWRREYSYYFEDALENKNNKETLKDLRQGITLTPSKILIGIGFILIVLFFGYLFYSYRNYSGPPSLEIQTPENNEVVDTSLIDVTGKTDIDSVLFINGEKILIKPDGSFAASLNLKEGTNTLSITSINKLDKKTEEVLTVIYRPQNGLEEEFNEPPESTPSIQ
jgi:hypothetical protein